MNTVIFRIATLLLHMLLNIAVVIYLTGFDITGSWLKITGFILMLFVLLVLFIRHIFSFIKFINSKSV